MKFGKDLDVIDFVTTALKTSTFLSTIRRINDGIFSPSELRALTPEEIRIMEKQRNIARDWNQIRVTRSFTPEPILGCTFLGNAIIGDLSGAVLLDGLTHPCGLINSTFHDVQIADTVLIKNVMTLANVTVMKGAALVNCSTIAHGEDTHFGVGKELSLAIENGGREIRIFPEITIDVARIICSRRDDKHLLAEYDDLIDDYFARAESPWSVVMNDARIMNCPKVLNFFIGEAATLNNVNCVKNTVVISNRDEPVTIEDGAYVADCVVQWGCHITTSAIAENSIFTEYSGASRHAQVIDSLIGSNSHVSEGEVTSSLVGSFVGFHHQALLISAFWPEGKGNVSYGANVGSNHTGKEPDQEIWPGEGTFFGLDCSIKFPTDFTQGPYSMISSGTVCLAQKMMFPFSLINRPRHMWPGLSPAINEIIPAWVLHDNIFTVWRNVGKYRQRNKAKRITIKYDILRPSVVDKMLDARARLEAVDTIKEYYLERDIPGLGKNYMVESVRQNAIDAYTYYARYYCLNEMKREIERRAENGEVRITRAMLFDLEQHHEIWEHALALWPALVGEDMSLDTALYELARLKHEIAEKIYQSKQKDDQRGVQIIRDYAHSHVSADDNRFVRQSRDEATAFEESLPNLLACLADN